MRPPLVLVAGGGLAGEVVEAVRAAGDREIVCIVDDDAARHGQTVLGVPVVPPGAGLREDADVVVCAGHGSTRRAVTASLGLPDTRYATVIHPGVTVPASCEIGAGSILLGGVVLTASVRIGRHVVVMPNAVLTHGDVLEDHVTLCAGVTLGGDVTVRAGAYLGMQACVRERLEIGAGATLGMGAVVTADVPPADTWVGVPARRIARRPRPAAVVA